MVLCSLVFIAMGTSGLYHDFEFNGNVGRTTATIQRLWTSAHGRGGTSYQASYNYDFGSAGVREAESRVGPATYYQVHLGEQVPIKFLFQDTEESRIDWPIEDQWHWQHDETGLGVGLFFASIGLIIAWCGRPRKLEKRK
jgi:hypothetical protein